MKLREAYSPMNLPNEVKEIPLLRGTIVLILSIKSETELMIGADSKIGKEKIDQNGKESFQKNGGGGKKRSQLGSESG